MVPSAVLLSTPKSRRKTGRQGEVPRLKHGHSHERASSPKHKGPPDPSDPEVPGCAPPRARQTEKDHRPWRAGKTGWCLRHGLSYR